MQAFRLPAHIHFCEIRGERIFLDLNRDRYFRLPPTADTAFAALLDQGTEASPELEALAVAGLLVPPPGGRPPAATVHPVPERSLIEEETGARASWTAAPEVLMLVLKARRAVSRRQLPRLIGPDVPAAPPPGAGQERLDLCVEAFLQGRRLVPIALNCLYDSLALRQFLRRRSIHADLVIGVKLHPFGAHCWLQDGNRVLNDTVASARDFAPILVA